MFSAEGLYNSFSAATLLFATERGGFTGAEVVFWQEPDNTFDPSGNLISRPRPRRQFHGVTALRGKHESSEAACMRSEPGALSYGISGASSQRSCRQIEPLDGGPSDTER